MKNRQTEEMSNSSSSDSSSNREWSELPKEILEMVGQRLGSRIDVFRYRAICSSWRSSVPRSHFQSPPQPLLLPQPIMARAFFCTLTICRLQLADPHHPSHLISSDGISSISLSEGSLNSSGGASNPNCKQASWLVKVEESKQGELQLLIPLSNCQIKTSSPAMLPKFVNMLRFRLVELQRAYSLRLARGSPVFGINKVLLHPFKSDAAHTIHTRDYGLLAIIQEGKLAYWRFGDDHWTFLDHHNFHYHDIITCKGQVYVVDACGTISWIDSAFRLVQYSPPLLGCGQKKNLVESCGDLYVVDRYLKGEPRTWHDDEHTSLYQQLNLNDFSRSSYPRCRAKTIDIRVYKLDEDLGSWVDVSSLDDRVFVLSSECSFSVSANDFPGCVGNCIYFTDPADVDMNGELNGYNTTRVFKLGDRSIARASSLVRDCHLFWPPRMNSSSPLFG